jgi:hypothetical protein
MCDILWRVPRRPCLVSFTDERGVEHTAEVDATSLFEAATLGLEALKAAEWTDGIGPGTRLVVEVRSPAVKHIVTVQQLRRWAESTAIDPAERLQKNHASQVLGAAPPRK